MKTPALTLTVLTVLSVAAAVTPKDTPIAQGQQWKMTVDAPLPKDLPQPITFTLTEEGEEDKSSVMFLQVNLVNQTAVGDALTYEFGEKSGPGLYAHRLVKSFDFTKSVYYDCYVRQPISTIGVAQRGLFTFGEVGSMDGADKIQAARERYQATGDLTGQHTCTLTRLK